MEGSVFKEIVLHSGRGPSELFFQTGVSRPTIYNYINASPEALMRIPVERWMQFGVIKNITAADGSALNPEGMLNDVNLSMLLAANADIKRDRAQTLLARNIGSWELGFLLRVAAQQDLTVTFSGRAIACQNFMNEVRGYYDVAEFNYYSVVIRRAEIVKNGLLDLTLQRAIEVIYGKGEKPANVEAIHPNSHILRRNLRVISAAKLVELGIITAAKDPKGDECTIEQIPNNKTLEELLDSGYYLTFHAVLDKNAFYKKHDACNVIRTLIAEDIGLDPVKLKIADDKDISYRQLKGLLQTHNIEPAVQKELVAYHRSLFKLDEAATCRTFVARLIKYHGVSINTAFGSHVYHQLSDLKLCQIKQGALVELLEVIRPSKKDVARAIELYQQEAAAKVPATAGSETDAVRRKLYGVDKANSVMTLLKSLLDYYGRPEEALEKNTAFFLTEVRAKALPWDEIQGLLNRMKASEADVNLVREMYDLECQEALHIESPEFLVVATNVKVKAEERLAAFSAALPKRCHKTADWVSFVCEPLLGKDKGTAPAAA